MIKIAPATLKDYDEISNLLIEVYKLHVKWYPNIYKDVRKVLSKEEFKKDIKKECYFVAKENNIIKGVIGINIFTANHILMVPRKLLDIHTLVVKEKYRGKGIGTLLINFVKKIKDERNIDSILLHVVEKNKEAKKLYKKCGFKIINHKMEL